MIDSGLGAGRVRRPGARVERAGVRRNVNVPFPSHMNVPFSHPSGGKAQKNGRKVRSLNEGTLTPSIAVDIQGGPPDPVRSPSESVVEVGLDRGGPALLMPACAGVLDKLCKTAVPRRDRSTSGSRSV